MSGLKSLIQKGQRYVGEKAWFSGLFDKSEFKPDKTHVSDDFQQVETVVMKTDKIDTYNLIFNVQMPSIVKSPFLSYAKDDNLVDYYCNNKIHVRLYFKDGNLFDNLTGTQCVLTPPLYKNQQASNFVYTSKEKNSSETSEEASESNEEASEPKENVREITVHDIKSSGMYFSSNNDINVTIENTVNQAIIDGNRTPKIGPFSESKEGVTKENLNRKLTNKKYLNPLVNEIDKQLSPKNPTSPFKVYNAQYTKKIDEAKGGLVSNTDYSDIEEKRRLFDSNYQHYMQFDFNLNQYTVSIPTFFIKSCRIL
jgi:hypothetical protein